MDAIQNRTNDLKQQDYISNSTTCHMNLYTINNWLQHKNRCIIMQDGRETKKEIVWLGGGSLPKAE